MGTLVSIILIAVAFLSVAAVLYFVVTEKMEPEEGAAHLHPAPALPEPQRENATLDVKQEPNEAGA